MLSFASDSAAHPSATDPIPVAEPPGPTTTLTYPDAVAR